jgi:hypothetical protein
MLDNSTARATSKSRIPEAPLNEPTPPSTTADDSMTNEEKDDMADQMEDFEGPDRRENRGDNEQPANGDPGVGSS